MNFNETNKIECPFEWAQAVFSRYGKEALSEVNFLIAKGDYKNHPEPRKYLAFVGKRKIMDYFRKRNSMETSEECFDFGFHEPEVPFLGIDSLKDILSKRQFLIVLDRMEYNSSNEQIAKRLHLSVSVVQRERIVIKRMLRGIL